VVNILGEAGFDPGPKRGKDTRDDIIKRHAATLWSCDFFSKRVWTLRGLVGSPFRKYVGVSDRRTQGLAWQPARDGKYSRG
jgi:hypothetical protein